MRFTDVAVLSQVLASGLVLAKPIERRQTTARTIQSVGSYSYVGCAIEPFSNGGSGRTLTNSSQSVDTNTVESCASFCSAYTYFAVEWSSECYCGDELGSGTALEADDTNCNMACAGDSTEFCGGSARMNLYSGPRASGSNLVTSSSVSSTTTASPSISSSSVSTTAAATTTTAVASASAYKYVTCAVEPFQNGVDSRALIDASTSDASMTVESCATYCAGYNFFAVEYSSQCYCGNKIQTGTTQDVGNNCNMPCSGNSLQQCGGAGVMNLYQVSSGPAVTLTTFSPATSTSSPAVASTSTSSLAVASTSTSSSAAASTSTSSSAVVSTSTSSSAVASTSTASSSTSTSSTSASSSAKLTSSASPASTTQTSSAVPTSTSTMTSSRSTSSAVSSFITSTTTTAARTSTSSSATKASTTAAATASATPSSFFSVSTCPKLSANLGLFNLEQTFTTYFSGSGVTENSVNPGASFLFPARTYQISGTNSACAAASLCIQQLSSLIVSYQSFDLHYRTDTARWECVAYKYSNVRSSYFNVRNPAISAVHGFSGVFA